MTRLLEGDQELTARSVGGGVAGGRSGWDEGRVGSTARANAATNSFRSRGSGQSAAPELRSASSPELRAPAWRTYTVTKFNLSSCSFLEIGDQSFPPPAWAR